MVDDATLSGLLGLVYEAACDCAAWPAFLAALIRATQSRTALIHLRLPAPGDAGCAFAPPCDDALLNAYSERYCSTDPWLKAAERFPSSAVFVGRDLVPHRELVETDFYKHWLRPNGLDDFLGSVIRRPGEPDCVLSLYRSGGTGPFHGSHQALLQALVPHVARAVAVQRRLARAEEQKAAALGIVDRFPVGVFVIDAQRRILFMNREARRLVSGDDGLRVREGTLCGARRRDTEAIRQQLGAAVDCRKDTGGGFSGALRVARSLEFQPLVLVTASLPDTGPDPSGCKPAAVVLAADPGRAIRVDANVLRRGFGLTPAEARLACLLVQGKAVEEAASELGVSSHTVRTQLQRVFSKTGTNRQATLVLLLAKLPPDGCAAELSSLLGD